jgi:branched-chain amino acid transport system permease protein
VYGALALALVLIHRATGIINFAQGEMATFSTYILWTLTVNHGWPYWPALLFTVGGVTIAYQDIGTICVSLGVVVLLWLFFQFTKVGLAMRAAAVNPHEARLVGVRVTWMLALGWGLAAVLGAVAGALTAPSVFLDPTMMQPILIYAFAAAVLGGIDSPVGAVVGGLALGVLLNVLSWLSQYSMFDWFTEELKLPIALAIILGVLLIKPTGLFGRTVVRKI